MPATYEPIATTTLGSQTPSITFSSIPATYTDLRVVVVCTASVNGAQIVTRFNGDTATNYSYTQLQGSGTTASSGRATSQTYLLFLNGGGSTTIPTFAVMDIFSYTGSTNKTVLTSNNTDKNGSGNVVSSVGLWRSTAAITSILLDMSDFKAGTTATLYGIKAA